MGYNNILNFWFIDEWQRSEVAFEAMWSSKLDDIFSKKIFGKMFLQGSNSDYSHIFSFKKVL